MAFIYNATVHSATQFSTFFLTHGIVPRLWNEIISEYNLAEEIENSRIGFPYTLIKELELAKEIVQKNFEG